MRIYRTFHRPSPGMSIASLDAQSTGFTVVEMLVSMAILGLLIAILLPAIQASRESARNTQCKNNLRQIGIACHNHLDAHRVFPCHEGPLNRILPFLEQQHANLDNAISTYLCPSDSRPTSPLQSVSSYLINDGTDLRYRQKNGFAVSDAGASVLPKDRDAKPSDFIDGMSNTASFSERLLTYDMDIPDDRSAGDRKRFLWHFTGARTLDIDQLASNCQTQRTSMNPAFFNISVSGWQTVSDNGYDHMLPPNSIGGCWNTPPNPSPGDVAFSMFYAALATTSEHTGHVNVLSADGSVRSVSDSVALQLWRAFGTRNGSESSQLQ